MAWALIQSEQAAEDNGADDCTLTYPATPTNDNLLVAFATVSRGDGDTASITTPSGWTAATTLLQNIGNTGASTRLFYKKAASEGSSLTISMPGANEACIMFAEFSGNDLSTLLDVSTQNTKTTSSDSTISTGTTAAIAANSLVVAGVFSHEDTATGVTWTNGLTTLEYLTRDHGNQNHECALALGYKFATAGAQETTATFTSGPDTEAMGHIAAFKIAAAGWTGKIVGVTNPAKINGIAVANIAKVNNVA